VKRLAEAVFLACLAPLTMRLFYKVPAIIFQVTGLVGIEKPGKKSIELLYRRMYNNT